MFKSFLRARPTVSIFHHPSSPQSNRALELLRSSLTAPYPPGEPSARPLEFDLEVVESSPPNPDQMQTIQSYLPKSESLASAFVSAHPSAPSAAEQPQSPSELSDLAKKNLNAVKWPIVVDWMGGRASIGDVDGVKRMLDAIKSESGGANR
ncbi:hypothetical protein BD410DRAFT_797620, partial [Rickenella mellea]